MSNYTPQQKIAIVMRQLAYVKSELHTAVNPMSLRDRVRDLVDAVEFAIGGYVSDGNPNQIPGTPASLLEDPTRTRVEFTSGPGAVQQQQEREAVRRQTAEFSPNLSAFTLPGAAPTQPALRPEAGRPIVNGDVQFIPGPPPGTSTGIGNGQSVEFIRADGVQVDGNGNPIGGVQSPRLPSNPFEEAPAAPIIPGADYRGGGPTRVEIVGGTHLSPPRIPGAPASNEAAGQIIGHQPSRTTEAGGNILPASGLFPGIQPTAPARLPQNPFDADDMGGSVLPGT
jgi:hypothetical protein